MDTSSMRTGCFIAGIAGNNGSTLAAFLCNKNRETLPGSIVRHGTVVSAKQPVSNFIQEPALIPVRGWDVRSMGSWKEVLSSNAVLTGESCVDKYSKILEESDVKILPGVYLDNFVHLPKEQIISNRVGLKELVADIETFGRDFGLDHVVVMYSGSTEKNCDWSWHDQGTWPPSVFYARAALEAKVDCSFVNCGAQVSTNSDMIADFNTKNRICVANHDLSTGQTKMKRHMLDFFMSCGFPLQHIVSRNELGNMDGFNLQGQAQNLSKITTKSSMLDACRSERRGVDQKMQIHHHVSINYIQSLGDDKLATDDFRFGLGFGRASNFSTRFECKDTLLAIPLLFDLLVLLPRMAAEKESSESASKILAYYFKSLVIPGETQFLLGQLNTLTEWIHRHQPSKSSSGMSTETSVSSLSPTDSYSSLGTCNI